MSISTTEKGISSGLATFRIAITVRALQMPRSVTYIIRKPLQMLSCMAMFSGSEDKEGLKRTSCATFVTRFLFKFLL